MDIEDLFLKGEVCPCWFVGIFIIIRLKKLGNVMNFQVCFISKFCVPLLFHPSKIDIDTKICKIMCTAWYWGIFAIRAWRVGCG